MNSKDNAITFQDFLKSKGICMENKEESIEVLGSVKGELTFAQKRMWFFNKFDPDSVAYNIPIALLIHGSIDEEVLEKSLNDVIKRHEIMRTTFHDEEGKAYQQVHSEFKYKLVTKEFKRENSINETLKEIFDSEFNTVFNIEELPLFKAGLFKAADDEYIFILNIHHIISDGWSTGILLKEVVSLYEYHKGNKNKELPMPKIQYLDYAVWQNKRLKSSEIKKQLNYCINNLKDSSKILKLPTDYKRPAIQGTSGSVEFFELSPEMSRNIEKFSRKEGITTFMFLIAAFYVLLYRYTGQEDILVGTPISGRNNVDVEDMLGLFTNTVVIKGDMSDKPNVREFLNRVKKASIEAFENSDVPFEMLVDELKINRNMSYSPLVQVMFSYQNASMPMMNIDGAELETLEIDSGFSQFDFSLSFRKKGDSLAGSFEYNTDLFNRETIIRMKDCYLNIINSFIENSEEYISKIKILSEEEIKIFNTWNETETNYRDDAFLCELFEEQAQKHGDSIALIYENEILTYKELNERANKIAHLLRKIGVNNEKLVATYFDYSIEVIVGILGVLKAGGAYMPLDTKMPFERIKYIMNDSDTSIILSTKENSKYLDGLDKEVIYIDEDIDEDIDNLEQHGEYDRIAALIYTSGSTGQPKGVLLENRALVNLTSSFIESYNVTNEDRVLPLTAIASSSFAGEILPIICKGGTVVLTAHNNFLDVENLIDIVNENNVSIISTVPSMLSKLNNKDIKFNKLRLILSGGEALNPTDIDNIIENITVVNGYGSTETTICSTYIILDKEDLDKYHSMPIGKPIMNTKVYILDKECNYVPIGCAGEIYISGAGVSRGYINSPEKTAERFIDNPFIPGEKMYKTGDLGIWLPDGNIRYLGREDNQIKIRGFRIELEEIENKILSNKSVKDCVVIVNDKKIVAYVVIKEGESITTGELKNWVSEELPYYMVPYLFMFIDEIPLNINGKVDIKQLPEPKMELNNKKIINIPGNLIEEKILNIWKETLGLDMIDVTDNFFDIGGHSLLIVEIQEKLKEKLGVKITVVDLFRYPTIRSLAHYLSNTDKNDVMKNNHSDESMVEKRNKLISRQRQLKARTNAKR